MIALIQRVAQASVQVEGAQIAAIDRGLLAFVGVEADDTEQQVDRIVERLLGYRVFPDHEGRMNRSLADTGGALLLVPQFTLAADTRKGMRPSFTSAASPRQGQRLFELLLARADAAHSPVEAGRFGVDMQVHLINDGPVTFWLQTRSQGVGAMG